MKNNSVLKILLDINSFLNYKSKLKVIYLLPVIFFNGLMQVISISTFLPLINIVMGENNMQEGFINQFIYKSYIQKYDIYQILFFIIFIFLISGIFQIISLRYITNTSAIIGNDITNKSFKKLFQVSFEQFQLFNRSRIIYTIINQTNRGVLAINSILLALNSLISLLLVTVSLIIINPQSVLFLGLCLSSAYVIIAKKLKNKLNQNSKLVTQNANKLTEFISNVFGLYREYRIENTINYEVREFNKLDRKKRLLSSKNQFYKLSPKPILEFVFVFSLLIFVMIKIRFGTPIEIIFGSISIFLVSFPKILPSMQQIYTTWAGLEGFKSDLISLRNHLNLKQIIFNSFNNFQDYKTTEEIKSISIKNLTYNYDSDSKETIFKELNFTIESGKNYAIIGKTGSGKSTFINILLGFIIPKKGNIYINKKELFKDFSVVRQDIENFYSQTSFASSKPYIFNGTILENISLFEKENYSKERIKKVSEICLCDEFINLLPQGFNTKLNNDGNNLSSGQLQRISIARSLYKEPNILIFDEATNALDLITELKLYSNIRRFMPKLTILLITHRKEIIDICDNKIDLSKF